MVDKALQLRKAIEEALQALARSQRMAGEVAASGSMHDKFQVLERTLAEARRSLDAGQIPDWAPLIGLVRWTADWIPDIDDPLLQTLEDVERRASIGT